jgi:hypothetical protein
MFESRPAEYVLTGAGGTWRFLHAPGSNDRTWCKVCKDRVEDQWEREYGTRIRRWKKL